MKRFFAIMISCIVLYGCRPGIPKEIIQPDQMSKVLFDIHVVDGYITTISNRDSAKIVASSFYKGIYKKFSIDSALYAKSMDYYYNHPDVMEKIYTEVEKTFVKVRAKNDKEAESDSAREQATKLARDNPSMVLRFLSAEYLQPKRTEPPMDSNPFRMALTN